MGLLAALAEKHSARQTNCRDKDGVAFLLTVLLPKAVVALALSAGKRQNTNSSSVPSALTEKVEDIPGCEVFSSLAPLSARGLWAPMAAVAAIGQDPATSHANS